MKFYVRTDHYCSNCEAHTGWFVEAYDNGTEYACDTCEQMWIEETRDDLD
jgi:hypothetical protein